MQEPGKGTGERRSIWRRPRSRWLFGIPVGGFLLFFVGIAFWGGFTATLEATNTEQFCTSCHEMRDYVYPEYKETIHFENRTGVRASCPDCHVPRPWIYKVRRKIAATNEVYHKIVGTVNTREKFEAKRLEMAQRVWATMKATDSRECRNCHDFNHMDFDMQEKVSARQHKKGFERGQTCIDCHKGVAHHLPEGYDASAYGGDFFAPGRSEWNDANLTRRQFELVNALPTFHETDARFQYEPPSDP